MLMDRLVVADVADLGEPENVITNLPRSATRGYSCARFLVPCFLIRISSCFVISLRGSGGVRTSQRDVYRRQRSERRFFQMRIL